VSLLGVVPVVSVADDRELLTWLPFDELVPLVVWLVPEVVDEVTVEEVEAVMLESPLLEVVMVFRVTDEPALAVDWLVQVPATGV